jgi:hypothetical protein
VPCELRPELRLPVKTRPHIGAAVADASLASPSAEWRRQPNRPPPAHVRFEHRFDPVAQGQISMADDPDGDCPRSCLPPALIAAMPATNSVSPTGRISGGSAGCLAPADEEPVRLGVEVARRQPVYPALRRRRISASAIRLA